MQSSFCYIDHVYIMKRLTAFKKLKAVFTFLEALSAVSLASLRERLISCRFSCKRRVSFVTTDCMTSSSSANEDIKQY